MTPKAISSFLLVGTELDLEGPSLAGCWDDIASAFIECSVDLVSDSLNLRTDNESHSWSVTQRLSPLLGAVHILCDRFWGL